MSKNCRYIKIANKIWRDEKFTRLSDGAKLLYIFILTSHHSNMAGYYVLPDLYIMEDLKWDRERVQEGLNELLEKGLINCCLESSVILIVNYLKYNPVENPNQAKGVNVKVKELPANSLVDMFKDICKEYGGRYFETLIEGLPKQLDKGLAKGLDLPFTKSETETEAETEEVEKHPPISLIEKNIIELLKEIDNYPFEFNKDLEFIRGLSVDFSGLNLLEELKKWKVYKLDRPLDKKSNPRSQFRNWLKKSAEWNKEDKSVYNNELILPDMQIKMGGGYLEKS